MTLLSCLAIGVAFLLAVALLLFAAVLLGWCVPGILERSKRAGTASESGRKDARGPSDPDPPTPPD